MLTSSYKEGEPPQHTGAVVHFITNGEKEAFQLTDSRVRGYFLQNRQPMSNNGVYYKDPTINGDKFKQMQQITNQNYAKQCQTVMRSINIRVRDREEELISIGTNSFTNNYSQTATFNTAISREETERTSSSWSNTHAFQAGYAVTAGVSAFFASVDTTVSFSYTFEYSRTQTKQREVTLGSTTGTSVPVLPGDSVHVILLAYEGRGEVQIIYQSTPEYGVCYAQNDGNNNSNTTFSLVTKVLGDLNLPTTLKVPQIAKVNNFGRTETTLNEGLPQ